MLNELFYFSSFSSVSFTYMPPSSLPAYFSSLRDITAYTHTWHHFYSHFFSQHRPRRWWWWQAFQDYMRARNCNQLFVMLPCIINDPHTRLFSVVVHAKYFKFTIFIIDDVECEQKKEREVIGCVNSFESAIKIKLSYLTWVESCVLCYNRRFDR